MGETRVVVPVDEQRVRELIQQHMIMNGCICPIGAERSCRGLMCPRQPVRMA